MGRSSTSCTPLTVSPHRVYGDARITGLKAEQVQRLCGIEQTMCQLVLDSLVDEKFLCAKSDGHYARLTDGHHPHPVKTHLETGTRSARAS